MNAHDNDQDISIARAAALRAAGNTWEAVGAAVDRHAETVRHWPDRYPDQWGRAYRAVESQLIADAATEARATLRLMLRAKKGKYRLGAAVQLLKTRDVDRLREARIMADRPADQDAQKILDELRSMSDTDLERHIADFLRAKGRLAPPGEGDQGSLRQFGCGDAVAAFFGPENDPFLT